MEAGEGWEIYRVRCSARGRVSRHPLLLARLKKDIGVGSHGDVLQVNEAQN